MNAHNADARVHCSAALDVDAAPAAVLACTLDPDAFAPLFRGFGPIPAIRRIVALDPPAVGARRQVHNSDGSVLDELILELQPPLRHRYRLSGFTAPLRWLLRYGEADWQLQPRGQGTALRWSYVFVTRGPWPKWLLGPLLGACMSAAMRRCLRALRDHLRSASG